MGKVDENKHQKMDALFQSAYDLFLNQGIEKKEAMKKVGKDRGISKREVYQALLKD